MKNERTDILTSTYTPKLSIVVYKSNTADQYYLESHNITDDGKMMEGKPLLQETIESMVDAFYNEKQDYAKIKGLIPDNMLSFEFLNGGNYKMAWYRPAEVRYMHFSAGLKLMSGKAWVPAMVYIAKNKSLCVYALRSNTRPTENSKIFMAPFHNVSGNSGSVCLGSAMVRKPKHLTYSNLQQYWEDLFWLSEFTHRNGDNPVKTDLDSVWKKLVASKATLKWSELNELVQIDKKSLKSIL